MHGVLGGEPQLQKTVIGVEAEANVSIRLVPGQDEKAIAAEMERLMREAAPEGADVEIELIASAPAALVQPDDPAIKLGQDAFERVIGARPLLIRIGGSLPVMAALESKQIPTILTGFDLPDGQHPLAERALPRRPHRARRRDRERALPLARSPNTFLTGSDPVSFTGSDPVRRLVPGGRVVRPAAADHRRDDRDLG